ncbi:type II toxin-antitoxin system RatA family toxin [Streptomyces sp. NPDC059070]|uniref:type II toxin-antitoxin system RatA family toxin n=1 Tax=Streptomyces sp. NPDC059070 TaxID=3346713 RepID=UPI0036A368D5
MPRVEVDLRIEAPPEPVWAAVLDVQRYPDCMDSVDSVTLVDQADAHHRTTTWSVRLQNSVLRWTEAEVIDSVARRFDFRQTSGDLGAFAGHWAVHAEPDGSSTVRLHVDFDIGIPLLADMLNPIAEDAFRENAAQMLAALEHRLQGHGPEMRGGPSPLAPIAAPDGRDALEAQSISSGPPVLTGSAVACPSTVLGEAPPTPRPDTAGSAS